jgi:amino acid adenylation domain-containing protein
LIPNLVDGVLRSCEKFADRPALEVANKRLTYVELKEEACRIAATIVADRVDGQNPYTAVLAKRSVQAFTGVLGALLAGHGYVPLNPAFPPARNAQMLKRSGAASLIVDATGLAQLDEILADIEDRLLIIVPDQENASRLTSAWPRHGVLATSSLEAAAAWTAPQQLQADAVAYLLFTSGSTGLPKGVKVAHRNICHYVDFVCERYGITEHDRLSQTFDMTFDLSVHDMFVAWYRGACVCCPDTKALLNPARFINGSGLTVWFSVPSLAVFMKRLGALKPHAYPGLRLSLFCGEPLPVEVAKAWSSSAPNSIVENLYGPTELTVACTYYRWDAENSPSEAELGTVPIGYPFPSMSAKVVDERLRSVAQGEIGELVMSGPQVTLGYLADPDRTSASFIRIPGEEGVFYRTGDRVRQARRGGALTYVGRLDHQLKVLGHRVELGEVEAAVRAVSGFDSVVAVGWPETAGGAAGLEVFVQADSIDATSIKRDLSSRLPDYMVPKGIRALPELPLNANGKIDRSAIVCILREQV